MMVSVTSEPQHNVVWPIEFHNSCHTSQGLPGTHLPTTHFYRDSHISFHLTITLLGR